MDLKSQAACSDLEVTPFGWEEKDNFHLVCISARCPDVHGRKRRKKRLMLLHSPPGLKGPIKSIKDERIRGQGSQDEKVRNSF